MLKPAMSRTNLNGPSLHRLDRGFLCTYREKSRNPGEGSLACQTSSPDRKPTNRHYRNRSGCAQRQHVDRVPPRPFRGEQRGRVDEIRYFGKTFAGICHFDNLKYESREPAAVRAPEVLPSTAPTKPGDAGLDWDSVPKDRIGVYLGITEHGNVETENEIYQIKQYDYDCAYWSHHHNPRTVANSPAGEVTLSMKITGPHYTIGAACAAGNAGLIQGLQQLRLGEVDLALAGGISESIHTFGIFAAFAAEGALARHDDPAKASRPFDAARNGIVVRKEVQSTRSNAF